MSRCACRTAAAIRSMAAVRTIFGGDLWTSFAANVAYRSTGQDVIFPGYAIHHFPAVKVGIVGMTPEQNARDRLALPVSRIVAFADEETVNALVPKLKQQGVETIIVLAYQGRLDLEPAERDDDQPVRHAQRRSGLDRGGDGRRGRRRGHRPHELGVNCEIDGKIHGCGPTRGGRADHRHRPDAELCRRTSSRRL